MNIEKRILIIGKVWPEPDSSAAGSRMMQLIELFVANDWKITFASPARKSGHEVNLENFGIEEVSIKVNSFSFDDFVIDLNPSIVLFDRFMMEEQFGWRVSEQCPEALKILDTEDLHCLRNGRKKAWRERREFKEIHLVSDIAKREIASVFRCDLSLIISKTEMDLLTGFFGVNKTLIHYLPFMLESLELSELEKLPEFDERMHFISIGNFLHEPNWNAVLYLKEEIWPIIRKELPETELHIYGAYSSQKAEQLHNKKEGFIIKGRAENAAKVVEKARVLLAPLRFGAGMKGKLIEAMQCGTPSVTTSIGSEAMHNGLDWAGVVADNPMEIAKAAVELYSDEKKWKTAQKNGISIVNECYPKTESGSKLIRRISKVMENLTEHRLQNFVGQMLSHHTLASTKYMAKWIEEKNT